jgi:hypothetical protein
MRLPTEPEFSQQLLEFTDRVFHRLLRKYGWEHAIIREFIAKAAASGLKIEKQKKNDDYRIILPGSEP